MPVETTLFFPVGSETGDEVCSNITIVDDGAFEKNEEFFINLESERNVIVITPRIFVHIQDDDCK